MYLKLRNKKRKDLYDYVAHIYTIEIRDLWGFFIIKSKRTS